MHFLSDRTTALHKEYLEKERLSLSFYLKSYPELCGKSACEILRTRCKEKKRIALLMLDIICHERYFDSFGNQYQASETVREWYNTEASFLYETFKAASETTEKYLFIFNGNKGVEMRCGDETELLSVGADTLVVDMCEHAYLIDYGFDRENYLKNALSYLNLSYLDKKICRKH